MLEAVERAGWEPPTTLTAVLLPESQVRTVLADVSVQTLHLPDPPDLDEGALLLVPDAEGRRRAALLRTLAGRGAVAGPARPWLQAGASYDRARRARSYGLGTDTEAHLPRLVLTADPEALSDLRAQALAPLDGLRPATAEKLAQTLRAWLLHQGRRERGRPCLVRAPADRALPHGPAPRAVRTAARRPGERACTRHRPRRGPTHGSRCPAAVASKAWSRHGEERSSDFRFAYDWFGRPGRAARGVTSTGNGYFCTRGCAEWEDADGTHYPGTYAHGIHNRRTTVMGIHPVPNEDLVNLPNWLVLKLRIEGRAVPPRRRGAPRLPARVRLP